MLHVTLLSAHGQHCRATLYKFHHIVIVIVIVFKLKWSIHWHALQSVSVCSKSMWLYV